MHCTWWVQLRGSRIRLYTHWVWRHMGPKDCARHTVKWITSVCQAAKQLCALCWVFWKIKVWAEKRPQKRFTITVCQWATTKTKASWDHRRWVQNIDWWAWIDGCVVFCHPVPHAWQHEHHSFKSLREIKVPVLEAVHKVPSFSWLGLFLISIQCDLTQIPAFLFQDTFMYLFCPRWDTFL